MGNKSSFLLMLLFIEYLPSYFYKLLHFKRSITSSGHTFFSRPTSAFAGKLFDKTWVRCTSGYLPALSASVFPYCYTPG